MSVATAVAPTTAARRAANPWFVAMAVSLATFMEVLDTSIANVALRYIAGGLSAAENDAEWVITSYLAANAAVLLLSGWLSMYLGRRNYYLLSVAVFTLSSAACGFATSLEGLILFRVLQGIGGGGLQPATQAVLVDTFPPEKQGAAQTLFGISALIAPVLGPTLGGYIADNYSWRWIFLINIPAGGVALALNYFLLEDPEYLKQQRAEMHRRPLNFDYVGLGLIVLAMSSMEVILSKGQEWDWYNDPFRRFHVYFAMFVIGGVGVFWWERRHPAPILNLAPLKDRNFLTSGLIVFVTFSIVYVSLTLLPGMMQSLFGYNAVWSGLVLSPAGLFSIPMMLLVGFLMARGVDARWLVMAGSALTAAGAYWFSELNLFVAPTQLIWPRVVQQLGTACMFAPLAVAAYKYLPKELRGAAAGIYAVLRNEGGSIGTSVGKTLVQRRQQFHSSRLVETLNPLYAPLNEAVQTGRSYFGQFTGDRVTSEMMTYQEIDNLRQQQALALSYLDAFWLCSMLALGLIVIALFMRPTVAQKGEHLAAE